MANLQMNPRYSQEGINLPVVCFPSAYYPSFQHIVASRAGCGRLSLVSELDCLDHPAYRELYWRLRSLQAEMALLIDTVGICAAAIVVTAALISSVAVERGCDRRGLVHKEGNVLTRSDIRSFTFTSYSHRSTHVCSTGLRKRLRRCDNRWQSWPD